MCSKKPWIKQFFETLSLIVFGTTSLALLILKVHAYNCNRKCCVYTGINYWYAMVKHHAAPGHKHGIKGKAMHASRSNSVTTWLAR